MPPTDERVRMAPGADGNGLACMLAELLRENLQKPGKWRAAGLSCGRVGIVAKDAEVSLTLEFARRSGITIHDGLLPDRALTITTHAERITGLSLVNIKLGLPVYHDAAGRAVLRDLLSGALRIDGLLRHPILLTLVTKVMSVNGG